MKKFLSVAIAVAFMFSIVCVPAMAADEEGYDPYNSEETYEDEVLLPTIEGGETLEEVTITITATTDDDGYSSVGATADGGFVTESDLTVEFIGTSDFDYNGYGESHTKWTATDGEGYTAEGGSDRTAEEHNPADTPLTGTITPEESNESDSTTIVVSEDVSSTTVTGTTPEEDPANYDFTEVTVTGSRTLTIDNIEYTVMYNEEKNLFEDEEGNQFSYNEDEDLWYWVNIWDIDWNPLYYQESPNNMTNEMALTYFKERYPEVYDEYVSSGRVIAYDNNCCYFMDANGDLVEDDNGNPIIITDGIVAMDNAVYKNWRTGTVSFTIVYTDDNGDLKTKTTRQGVCMRVVGDESWDNEDVWFNYNNITQIGGLYCLDVTTGIHEDQSYDIVSIEDAAAEGYYTEEEAATLRAILTYGYDWGYNDDDGDDPHGTQALNEMLTAMYEDEAANDIFEAYGLTLFKNADGTIGVFETEDGEYTTVSRQQAATATGMAIWAIGNRFEELYGENCNVSYSSGDALTDAICKWLLTQSISPEESDSTEVITTEKFIDDLKMTVYDKVEDSIFNQDDDDTNDVYNVSFQFAMVVTPGEDDSLIVSVIDGEGNSVKTVRIAGENAENEDYEIITADDDGYYTIDGLELQEGYCNYSLKLDGAQYLEEGVYVFQSADDGHASQNFIGNYEGYTSVEAELNISFEFKVDEATVTTYREWRKETKETTPNEPDGPEGPEDPDEPGNPEKPDLPGKPDKPNRPTDPETPEAPSGPADPGTPEEPSESENPEGPIEPTEPQEPEEPVVPETPVDDPEDAGTDEPAEEPKDTEEVEEPSEKDDVPQTDATGTANGMLAAILATLGGLCYAAYELLKKIFA